MAESRDDAVDTQADPVDVVILGAGSGGYACALRAAQLGLSVVLVEQDRLGGTCLHVGCIPTKALLHAAELADGAREAGQYGVRATLEGVDADRVIAYADGVVGRLHKGLTGLIKSRGIRVVQGTGRLTGPHEVTVEQDGTSTRFTGRHVVLATGSAPKVIPGIEVDGERILTSDHALRLDPLPRSAIVLGGGVIGCEFASLWRSFGVEVTIVEALPRLVAGEDAASSVALERAFRKRGITARTGTAVESAKATDTGVEVVLADGETLAADVLLVAVGRGPRTADLGFEAAGVTVDRGFVPVDERCATGVDGVWAVGDITPGLQLAHRGFQQGILVAEHIAGLAPQPIDERGIPRVTYSRPEVASVGLTEDQAKEEYGADAVRSVTYDLGGNGRSQILKTQGFVKLVQRVEGADGVAPSGPVVGIHLVGERVGELIGEAQLIYGWEADPADVTPLVHAHPTQNEALGEAHLALAGKPLHAHT